MHQPLSSVSNMGRSGTQIVYYGNWKRLLQDKRRHEEDSINIENFNKVVETLNMKNPALSPTWIEGKNRLRRFFLRQPDYKHFLSWYFRSSIPSHLQGISYRRKATMKIWSGNFLSCNQRRRMKKSSAVSSELTTWRMDQFGKVLRRNEFSSTTTASMGLHDYWKAPECTRQWRSL